MIENAVRTTDSESEEKRAEQASSAIEPALSDDLRGQIREEAAKAYPAECCGFVIGKGAHQRLFPCRNISIAPKSEFYMHPEDVIAAEEAGPLLMSYHSHPNTGPSAGPADKTNAESNEIPALIVSITKVDDEIVQGGIEIYYPTGWKAELRGRPFFHGILDCYTLAQDYYATLGIILPDYPREDVWWEKGQNLYLDNLEECQFERVDDLRPHDAILMCYGSAGIPNHVAIYLGDGHILHHPPGRISTEQPYLIDQGYYAKITYGIYRHATFR